MLALLAECLTKPDRVLKRIRRQRKIRRLAAMRPCRVVVGASGRIPEGWIGTEVEDLDLLRPNTWERFFEPESIDAILAEHVWEHLSDEEGCLAAATCFRFLKSGGYLRLAVPDGNHPDPSYIEHVRPGGSGPGCDDHKVLYNYKVLSKVFERAGFQVKLLEYFDEDGQFVRETWNPADGMIRRSERFDLRNNNGRLAYTSIVLDAVKSNCGTARRAA